jgi:hypothetical protein
MGFWYKARGFSVRNSYAAFGFERIGKHKETFNAQSSVLPLQVREQYGFLKKRVVAKLDDLLKILEVCFQDGNDVIFYILNLFKYMLAKLFTQFLK